MDKLIYCQKQDGSFVKVGEPRGNPNRDNFLLYSLPSLPS